MPVRSTRQSVTKGATPILNEEPSELIETRGNAGERANARDTRETARAAETDLEEDDASSKPDEPELSLNDKVKEMLATIVLLSKSLKSIETDLKSVRVLYKKEIKENNKRNKQKKPRKSGNSEPHGFVKEVKISDDLADFLKLPRNSKMARPKVTKAISQYVKANNLSRPDNKTIFIADKALKKILGEAKYLINKKKPELGKGYSYFNLQTHLVNHFIKDPVANQPAVN
jgi:chromatin remodeling complex protein RSC6